MKAARPPSEATPAAVLPAEPPERSIAPAHVPVQRLGARGVDQVHRALGKPLARRGNRPRSRAMHVDDGVADAENVERGSRSWAYRDGGAERAAGL